MNSLATVGLQLATAQKAQASQEKQLTADQDRRVEELLARTTEAKRESQEALKRRLAQERARAGAAGLGTTGGSIDAVLRGLSEENETEQRVLDRDLESRLAGLNESYSTRRRKSLLEKNNRWLAAGSRGVAALSGSGRSLLG